MGELAEFRLSDIRGGNPPSWAKFPAGVLWAFCHDELTIQGIEAAFVSSVPIASGLSSSAAIQCAMAIGISDLFGSKLADDDPGRRQLASMCRRGENEIALAPTGGMDQTVSLRSKAGYALYLDCRDDSIEYVRFAPETKGLVLMIVNTRVTHHNDDGQYGARRADCIEACQHLNIPSLRNVPYSELEAALGQLPNEQLRMRVRHVVTEIERVRQSARALRQGDYSMFGQLLAQSHRSLRDDFEVSGPELDAAVESALEAGALGARMTGGGFGGSIIALVDSDRVDRVSATITDRFMRSGFSLSPQFGEGRASAPAGAAGWHLPCSDGPPPDARPAQP